MKVLKKIVRCLLKVLEFVVFYILFLPVWKVYEGLGWTFDKVHRWCDE